VFVDTQKISPFSRTLNPHISASKQLSLRLVFFFLFPRTRYSPLVPYIFSPLLRKSIAKTVPHLLRPLSDQFFFFSRFTMVCVPPRLHSTRPSPFCRPSFTLHDVAAPLQLRLSRPKNFVAFPLLAQAPSPPNRESCGRIYCSFPSSAPAGRTLIFFRTCVSSHVSKSPDCVLALPEAHLLFFFLFSARSAFFFFSRNADLIIRRLSQLDVFPHLPCESVLHTISFSIMRFL